MQTITSPTTTATDAEDVAVRRIGWPRSIVRPRLRRTLIAVTIAAAAAGAGLAGQAAAAPKTVKVQGTLKNQVVTGADCPSPVDLCFKGAFYGSLKGPDEAIVNSLTPTQTPDVFLGQASATIHDKRGDLICDEEFLYNTSPTSDGHFAYLCEITGGTGRYAGASGYIRGSGITPPEIAQSLGTYVGVIELK
jgi:hypothetical protein